MTDDEFDLFGDLDPEEQIQATTRQKSMHHDNNIRLKRLQQDPPEKRTIATNRWIYSQVFRQPSLHPCVLPHLLSPEECDKILSQLPTFTDEWTMDRHSVFPTTDIPIASTPSLHYLTNLLQHRLVEPILAPTYGFAPGQLGFRDLFLVCYDSSAQNGLAPHTDGCLLSFNVLINSPDGFDGGGTLFFLPSDDLTIRPNHQGDAVYHDAHIRHQGLDITRGQRIVLVGFVDTVDTLEKDRIAQQLPKRRMEY
ncbi:uncharacterized protein BX664DRAFT_330645 [Halteromyces radiatus]|uniref:uncharacterized protein n=1 Tax=Halteromyces radiatus TaxID=101107 RepID=UPI00221F8C00|nr:uncharacterized protein BX664DRAFT_330645 [Halteromyces radiatus]KAI8093816.1 hypothetical protein BX664DRAFT_330645 [Halteromyces radiatus]